MKSKHKDKDDRTHHKVNRPLIMRPKKDHHDEENKFLQSKRVMDKVTLKLKHPVKEKEEPAGGSSVDGVSLKFQSFKIPKKKDPEKAKLVKFIPILKASPGAFVPNEEASDELRGELERKVRE